MGNLSYSFHLSNGKHALTTVSKVEGASNHNLRRYQKTDGTNYDREKILTIFGDEKSILSDVKRIYDEEFEKVVKEYNERQTRDDRKIENYLKHVSDSRSDVAAEIIIQVGDEEFWKSFSYEQRKKMTPIFKQQLERLKTLCPDFKIANATVHFDEKSPHMHVIGVPIAKNCKRGLSSQVVKTKVFTQESLTKLQEGMRKGLEHEMYRQGFGAVTIKDKEEGRNMDFGKEEYGKIKRHSKNFIATYGMIPNKELDEIDARTKLTFLGGYRKITEKDYQRLKHGAKIQEGIVVKGIDVLEQEKRNEERSRKLDERERRLDERERKANDKEEKIKQLVSPTKEWIREFLGCVCNELSRRSDFRADRLKEEIIRSGENVLLEGIERRWSSIDKIKREYVRQSEENLKDGIVYKTVKEKEDREKSTIMNVRDIVARRKGRE